MRSNLKYKWEFYESQWNYTLMVYFDRSIRHTED